MTKTVAAALLGIGLLASRAALAAEKTITLAVPGMDCAACPVIVKSSLEGVPGVVKAVVSYNDKTAVVTFDDQKTNPSALMAATAMWAIYRSSRADFRSDERV
jgi:periplasmic mercuric ion binding protein